MALYLTHNLEYHGEGRTCNHIINNARALLFAGALLSEKYFIDIAKSILRSNLPELVTVDGFLREGSSHYQYIFSRWILEIKWLSNLIDNKEIHSFITPFANSVVKQCLFFNVEDTVDNKSTIPLIGDVSPDYPVSWLISLPYSKMANINNNNVKIKHKKTIDNDWASILNKKPELFNDD